MRTCTVFAISGIILLFQLCYLISLNEFTHDQIKRRKGEKNEAPPILCTSDMSTTTSNVVVIATPITR